MSRIAAEDSLPLYRRLWDHLGCNLLGCNSPFARWFQWPSRLCTRIMFDPEDR